MIQNIQKNERKQEEGEAIDGKIHGFCFISRAIKSHKVISQSGFLFIKTQLNSNNFDIAYEFYHFRVCYFCRSSPCMVSRK